MKNTILLIVILLLTAYHLQAQIAINNDGSDPNPSAMLDITSSDKGFLVPRMTKQERLTISTPAKGLLIYQTEEPSGFYYNKADQTPDWVYLKGGAITDIPWITLGNSGTTSGINFLGTTDKQALDIRTNDHVKIRIGVNGQIEVLNTGQSVFIGEGAGINDGLMNNENVAIGDSALTENIGGKKNIAIGSKALFCNSYAYSNIAIGNKAMYSNKVMYDNLAIGTEAMRYANNQTTMGYNTDNTAIGNFALRGSTTPSINTGTDNTAVGSKTMSPHTSGNNNTAIGSFSMHIDSTGHDNTAVGCLTLCSNITGVNNTALGSSAGFSSTGNGNVFIGYKAGYNFTGDSSLYISNSDTTTPLIFGDFSSGRIGLGLTNPQAKLEIHSTVGESPLWVRINTVTKLKVHPNGSVSIGTYEEGPQNGLIIHGNTEPTAHKSYDLGANGKAWDNIYYDDLHNQGASAFEGRNTSKEIVQFPPRPKQPGSLDYKTKTGDVELDPKSMPPGLADDNSLLTDEISSYNYKTNYQQQLLINKQKQEINQLKGSQKQQLDEIETLKKQLKEMEVFKKRLKKLEEKMK